jgi:hypothetical protein
VINHTVSEAGTATLKIEPCDNGPAQGKRVKRYTAAAGTLTRKGEAGAQQVKFSGRIGKKALKPGRYRLTISARDAADNTGKACV